MSSSVSLSLQVIGAKPGTAIETVPGRTYAPLPPDSLGTLALAELVPTGEGTYRAVARVTRRKFSITRANLARLGIAISDRSLGRLVAARLVAGERVTPNCTQFDYFDYLRHEAAVRADPEFWSRREPGHAFTNLERYQQTL